MNSELIVVGSELLAGAADTNSAWIAARLARVGVAVRRISLVGDDEARIAHAVEDSLGQAEVVIVTGGLGPTEDDRTRAALARALRVPLERDRDAQLRIESRFRERGRTPDAGQARQADRPLGARLLDNPIGIAPGIAAERGASLLFALPGVPAEMKPMYEASVEPALRARARGTFLKRVLKVAGRTESSVDLAVRDLYATPNAEVTILARPTGIELVLLMRGATEEDAQARLLALEEAMARRLGADLFGRDDETLASVVGAALLASGRTLATAESCTGGLLAATITEVPGSSAWFRGGLVPYANDLKTLLADVDARLFAEQGAVSGPVAVALAEGARARCAADCGIGITGIAGPSGATEQKPVGLVHVALSDAEGSTELRLLLSGDRDLIRRRAVTQALDRLRRRLGALP